MFGDHFMGGVHVAGVAVVWRSAVPFPNDLSIAHSFANIVPPKGYGSPSLLIDLRAVCGRNDSTFETLVREPRRRMVERFAKTVVLVRSRTGALQLQRFAREDGADLHIAIDEQRAGNALGWSSMQFRSALFKAQMAVSTMAAKVRTLADEEPQAEQARPEPERMSVAASVARDAFRTCSRFAQRPFAPSSQDGPASQVSWPELEGPR